MNSEDLGDLRRALDDQSLTADSHEAMVAATLVRQMWTASDRRGNLGVLKQIRALVQESFSTARQLDPTLTVEGWAAQSSLVRVLGAYTARALTKFEPEAAGAEAVRKALADAFGVTFASGGEPISADVRKGVAAAFNAALRERVKQRADLDQTAPGSGGFDSDDVEHAYKIAFKRWAGRDYDSSVDQRSMKQLRSIVSSEMNWL